MAEQLTFGLVITDPQKHRQQLACKHRMCLACSGQFASTGPGNRICSRCKSTEVFACSPVEFSVHAAF
jgi:hypothetical protein